MTSGAIGAGMGLLSLKKRPAALDVLQATAAIGQVHLIRLYGEYFKRRGYLIGQILLTQDDFNDRKRFLNIKQTMRRLLEHNAIPVINENDTVATDEIRCGDNDRLSGLVADACGAGLLIMLTDVDGLLDEKGHVISSVAQVSPRIARLAGGSRCDLGTGGMATKIAAARYATAAGIDCVIANGKKKGVIASIAAGESVGTRFGKRPGRLIAKKRWIAFSSRPKGELTVDAGARDALSKKDKSLLASGIVAVSGGFNAGDMISVLDKDGAEFARGLVNYSSQEIAKIKGLKTDAFGAVLGYKGRDEIIHKDNLVIL